MHQTTPIRVPRTSGLRRIDSGLGRNCYGPFRSPRLFPRTELPDDSSEESLKADIQKLKEKQDMLDKEISQLVKEGYCVIELEDHIALLHEYNDIKDVAQMLLGKLESQAQGLLRSKSEQDLTTCKTRLRSLISTACRDLEITWILLMAGLLKWSKGPGQLFMMYSGI